MQKTEGKEKTGKTIAKEILQEVYKNMQPDDFAEGSIFFGYTFLRLTAEEMKKLKRIISR